MDNNLIIDQLRIIGASLTARLRRVWNDRSSEAGMSTLEVAVISLGLLVIAAVLVTAIGAAVKARIGQIK